MSPAVPVPVLVFVHVQYFPDLRGGTYTVAVPRKRGSTDYVGETYVVEDWAEDSEAAAWAYACIHAVLAAVEHGYRPADLIIRGDRTDLGRLLKVDWDGQLGLAVLRYRTKFGASVRFQHRAGDRLPAEESSARVRTYRAMLVAHRRGDPAPAAPSLQVANG